MRAHNYIRNFIAIGVLALGLTPSLPAMATHQSNAVGNFDAQDSQTIEEIVRIDQGHVPHTGNPPWIRPKGRLLRQFRQHALPILVARLLEVRFKLIVRGKPHRRRHKENWLVL